MEEMFSRTSSEIFCKNADLQVEGIALGAKVGGCQREGLLQGLRPADPQGRAVKVGQQPLVGVHVEGVHQVQPLEEMTLLWKHSHRSCIGCINMCPAMRISACSMCPVI